MQRDTKVRPFIPESNVDSGKEEIQRDLFVVRAP